MKILTASVVLLFATGAHPASAAFTPSRTYKGTLVPRAPAPNLPVRFETGSDPGFANDLEDVRDRIKQARRSGVITKQEARQLRRETYVLERHAETYSRGGYSDSEREELETRSRYLSDAVFRTVK